MAKKGKSGSKGIPSNAGPQIWPRGGSNLTSRGEGKNAVGDMTNAVKQPRGKRVIPSGGKRGK